MIDFIESESDEIINGLNINRLHYVVENRDKVQLPRGIGKTTSRIYDLIGNIFLDESDIIVIMGEMKDFHYLKNLIEIEFQRMGIDFHIDMKNHSILGQRFRVQFTTFSRLCGYLRGRDPIIIHMKKLD